MKFTIDKNLLLENLSNVIKAISTKNIIPILNGIKFEMTDDGLYLTATDGELTIQTFIESKKIKNVKEKGIIIIQSKYLLDIIRKMPEDNINIEVIDGLKIKIFTNKNQYSLNCLDPKEYPKFEIDRSKTLIKLESNKSNFFCNIYSRIKTFINRNKFKNKW